MTKLYSLLHRTLLTFSLLMAGSLVLSAQVKLPEGFSRAGENRLMPADSLFPDYYLSYGSGGYLREGIYLSDEQIDLLEKFVPVPVLIGNGISRDESLEFFNRAVQFNLSGNDPKGQFQGINGKGNIIMPIWLREYLAGPNAIEKLYDIQLQLGNAIVVDGPTKFPLYLDGSSASYGRDGANYHACIFHWAAAYPWYFYALPNIALREALARKSMEALMLFAQNRYFSNPASIATLAETFPIPVLKL